MIERRAIGSSYFIQTSAGSEDFGGLEVVLKLAPSADGCISIETTLWPAGESTSEIDGCYIQQAVAGVEAYARERSIDLKQFDITLRRFVLHDVNSNPRTYSLTAQNAVESAFMTLLRKTPQST